MTIERVCPAHPDADVWESNPAPGIFVYTCGECNGEICQEQEMQQAGDPDDRQDFDGEDYWR